MAGKPIDSTGIFQLETGNWGYRFRLEVGGKIVDRRRVKDENGNLLLTKTAAAKARKAAIAFEKKQMQQEAVEVARSSVLKDNTSAKTVAQLYEEYCQNGRSDRAYNTKKKQDSLWKNHIKRMFGKRRINDITAAEVTDYLTTLYYEKKFAYRYVESFLKIFYLIFGQAYTRGYLSADEYNVLCKNKDSKIHMPKLKITDDMEIVAFSRKECEILDQYFAGTNAETAYLLGRYCGLRINECYGLKWSQVDFENGVIRIEHQMQYQDGLIRIVPLKTRNARRSIYMSDRLRCFLEERKKQFDQVDKKLSILRKQKQTFIIDLDGSPVSSLEFVNCLMDGTVQTVNSMKYHSKQLKVNHGINFKYHYLRHTYGTHLAEANVPSHILCTQMGHGNINVTQKYYLAVTEDGVDALKNTLSNI